MKVAIIGGGAAGFFAAISCKQHNPIADVIIFEKTSKLLAKVKVSGGGRCNVTNACQKISELVKNYPRGEKFLKKAFTQFSTQKTIEWFESSGVELKTESDNRMFPITDDSQTIIDCLLKEVHKLSIYINQKISVLSVERNRNGFNLKINDGKTYFFDKIVVATGGSPKLDSYLWLKELGHNIEPPVPSLFTFNMPRESIKSLMGVVVPNVTATIQGTKYQQSGSLLITHWGMSGPAILKLSAFAARHLQQKNYEFSVRINWVNQLNEEKLRDQLDDRLTDVKKRKISNTNPFDLPSRLWSFLLQKSGVDSEIRWDEIGKKQTNKLVNIVLNDNYTVRGKTTFKEEFVTCGGISLSDISPNTMESKVCPGLYFAGEIMDIDGITGGFNFQAAWTTGFIAGKLKSI